MRQILRLAAFTLIVATFTANKAPAQQADAEFQDRIDAQVEISDGVDGHWVLKHLKDEMTDEVSSRVYTLPMEASPRGGILMFGCSPDKLMLVYNWGEYFGGNRNEDVRVQYRIDSTEAERERSWRLVSSAHDVAAMPLSRVDDFRDSAITGETVLLRVTDPFDGETLSDRFNLFGLADALKHLPCAL